MCLGGGLWSNHFPFYLCPISGAASFEGRYPGRRNLHRSQQRLPVYHDAVAYSNLWMQTFTLVKSTVSYCKNNKGSTRCCQLSAREEKDIMSASKWDMVTKSAQKFRVLHPLNAWIAHTNVEQTAVYLQKAKNNNEYPMHSAHGCH